MKSGMMKPVSPAEFHGRADGPSDRIGSAVDERLALGVAMRAAHRRDPGLTARRQLAGVDGLGGTDGRAVEIYPLRAAADDAAPEQSESRRLARLHHQRRQRLHQAKGG